MVATLVKIGPAFFSFERRKSRKGKNIRRKNNGQFPSGIALAAAFLNQALYMYRLQQVFGQPRTFRFALAIAGQHGADAVEFEIKVRCPFVEADKKFHATILVHRVVCFALCRLKVGFVDQILQKKMIIIISNRKMHLRPVRIICPRSKGKGVLFCTSQISSNGGHAAGRIHLFFKLYR